jgi:hypothetical protein
MEYEKAHISIEQLGIILTGKKTKRRGSARSRKK